MSELEIEERGLAVLPKWWPVAVTIISSACAGAAAWGATSAQNAAQDAQLADLRTRISVVERIDRRLSNIEGRLGISSN